ncbi:unnamed protein product [Gongylonema pulchrum]|uniref:Uncharacterized protein n=1 Tax=Gongylonema pulchrum TaxID=637853 RepID=A0A183EY28_9BILA|nr:unnamed protein product [Gongylonema pulchrum]
MVQRKKHHECCIERMLERRGASEQFEEYSRRFKALFEEDEETEAAEEKNVDSSNICGPAEPMKLLFDFCSQWYFTALLLSAWDGMVIPQF